MRKKRKIVNLYEDESTLNIKHVISISSEEDLNNFWDYLTSLYTSTHYPLHTFITQFYNFALSYLLKKELTFFEIILESTQKHIYFTIWNRNISNYFKNHIEASSLRFKHDGRKISIQLDNYQKKIAKKVILEVKVKTFTEAYTFIEPNDLDELLKFSDDMQELMIHSRKVGLHINIFISLRSILSMFCLTLRYYEEISKIANVITEFSNLINTNKDRFIDFKTEEISLVEGFLNNIDNWLHTLFIKGGADLHFMDNSIEADYQMIEQIITPLTLDDREYELDDIFDF